MDVDPKVYENMVIKDAQVREIVLSYLVHNCFKDTAETFLGSTGMMQPTDYLANIEKRKTISYFAREGNALTAIELTDDIAPNLLKANEGLHFDLLSLHFIDLVLARKCDSVEALDFAQSKLGPFGEGKYTEKLENLMTLLAFADPKDSPVFHLLAPEYRQNIAENLNRAILAHAKLPSYSSLEMLIQQATVVRQYLHDYTRKELPPFSLRTFLRS